MQEEKTSIKIDAPKELSFIHLRTHSHYSILKSLPQIKQLVSKAKEYEMPFLALTDYNNMHGAIEFYKACKAKEIKPIIGVELDYRSESNSKKKYKLVFLVKNNDGYKSLMNLVSIANLRDQKDPHITFKILKENLNQDSGLIILSGGGDGEIADFLIKGNFEKSKKYVEKFEEVLGKNSFYLEIVPQTYFNFSKELKENTIKFAKEILNEEWRLIATQNSHYLSENDKSAHKVLFNIHGELEDDELYKYKFVQDDFSFIDTKKAEEIFGKIEKKYNINLIKNTFNLAESLNCEIELGKWHFPNIAIDYQKELDAGETLDDVLKRLAEEGLIKREIGEERKKDVLERLYYELDIIKTKGYAPYFLVVYDLLKYAADNGILTNIRGSVAGSMATYLLQITKCDPLIYQIPFERFLNPERPSAPDIDMDYADNRRDEMINYVRGKYGEHNVAQIGTFGTMLARGAVKDVARAMKYPYSLGDRISKMIPMPKQGFPVFIDTALEEVEDLKNLYDTEREVQIIVDMARKVEGLVRHIGVHAAGVVISPDKVETYSPIQWDPKGEGKIITQYDMHSVDEDNAGLLKFDFLGIRNLTILKTAINLVKERYGKEIDIEKIDLEDKKTFEMLANGETMGLFQLNGSGMTKFLKDLKPTSIFDINAMVALYRPGPINNIPVYIERKHNPKLVTYLYDDKNLKEILEKSFGVLVYQDDLLLMAIKIAGYTWGEADKFRKAVGKKIPEEMQKQKEKFINGCVSHSNWPLKKAEELWHWIEPFAAYGFNKAHSASYGRVAYQTAFMKANYPIAFITSILTEESGDIDKISEIVNEAERMGIKVLPPDVNYSLGGFSITEDEENKKHKEAIRFGLYTIKNMGAAIADAIIEEREKKGVYKNLEDFMNRINHKDLNRKSLEALIKCGAMDKFGERNQLLFNVDSLLEYHKKHIKDNKEQDNLFSFFEDTPSSFTLKECEPVLQNEKLKWEKELLGSYISGSPLDKWKNSILNRTVNIQNILEEANKDVQDNQKIKLPVLIDKIKTTKTRAGDYMALVKISDLTGQFEVAVFPKVYKILKEKLIPNVPLTFSGRVANKNGEKTMVVDNIEELK
ncbi:DNA polymerase III subunit alpha [bioreactor metagenome]|uniref:DNA-directed DNA polymerase n=1 Tax=bioreactor metagenome TaxID=1076179 RepID=A0A644T623_9ZZZZ|nr:DNA polymerase III subunit alpha [Candidatus Elulimicrobiales bacterium]